MEENKSPSVGASLGATINTGNFENYKIDVWLTGVPVGASEEYIKSLHEASKDTLFKVVMILGEELGNRIEDMKSPKY